MEISAIILAGGRSSRMGRNKAMLPLAGVPVIERLIGQLEQVVGHIVIAGGNNDTYGHLGVEVVHDVFPEKGPLSGLHAGLTACSTLWSLVVACDMPFADQRVFWQIAESAANAESDQGSDKKGETDKKRTEAIVASVGGRLHPLLGAYRRSVLPGLSQELINGNLKMTKWVESLQVEYVDEKILCASTGLTPELLQFNMNKPDDYLYAKRIFNSEV
ncbi:putative molybdenum cofactor guanylyltransferase [compost metagenome]